MRLRNGSGVMAGVDLMRFAPPTRHAELVSASIAPHAQVLRGRAAGAVCALDTSAQTEGWTLKQVQGDDDFRVFG